jgi:chemotaxis protein histidine kinase CheA
MATAKASKPDVITYSDHEVITPDTSKLRKTVRQERPGEADPVARAEAALAQISGEFGKWMDDECDRLDAARRRVKALGLNKDTRQELFLAAHDVKGDSGTFGFPHVVPAAESLCRLLEHTPDVNRVPTAIIDQHVDAVRAIVREYMREDISNIAAALTMRLRQVTDEFLVAENKHRPDYLPSMAPLFTTEEPLP